MFVSGSMHRSSISGRKPYLPGQVLPVLPVAELLLTSRHQGILRQFKDLSRLSPEEYERLYLPVLHQFAEFVQLLPMENEGPLSGLLNVSLATALAVFKSYVVEFTDDFDPLIAYAVFTAGLLRHVAKVIINQKVVLCTEEGEYVADWLPFSGSMVGRGEFYKLYPLAPIYQRLEDSITPALARQLLPEAGFLWITSDLQVYADWLDALCGRDGQGGRVSRALSLLRREDIYNISSTLDPIEVPLKHALATELGEAFFVWLKEGIEAGTIPINTTEAGVHLVADMVFLEHNKVFHQFAQMMDVPVSINVVITQFGNMFGIAQKGGADFMNAQFFSKQGGGAGHHALAFSSPLGKQQSALRTGMLLADPSMVFMNAQIPATTPLLKSMQTTLPAGHNPPATTEKSRSLGVRPDKAK